MQLTIQQAVSIVKKIATQNSVEKPFDLFDPSYISHLVNRINEPNRIIPNGHTKTSIFSMWVFDEFGLNDCWDSTQLREQKMSMR